MFTLAHIKEDRGCKICRHQSKSQERREDEYAKIAAIVAERGDTLDSTPAEYKTQKSILRLTCSRQDGCCKEFKQVAAKIKIGQLHGCDKKARARQARAKMN
jgi:hypothetical protein